MSREEDRLRLPAEDGKSNSFQTGTIKGCITVKSAIPKKRQELLKWNGWGYNDSRFIVKDGLLHFTGKRYPIGEVVLPYFADWAHQVLNVDLTKPNKPQELPSEDRYPIPNITPELIEAIKTLDISYSLDGIDRLIRSHGHTLHDVYVLRNSFFERIPDVVVWPMCHDDVVRLVTLADENNVAIVVFGGGTAVSGASLCPNDPRTIVLLDTSQMNGILWIDEDNLTACCQSGIIGQDLEKHLRERGYTVGHEPDSYEFSSLGGWVATRASGMKKNVYGNIEDLVVHVRMVTPKGVLEKGCLVPRLSSGPDFNHLILGCEGSFGVITDVVLKIRPLPACRRYGSVVFPNFESGVNCMRQVAKLRCQPASIRLMDNEQFKFGHSLKAQVGYFRAVLDELKKLYITKVKKFDVNSMTVMTLLFEGEKKEVDDHERKIYGVAKMFGGLSAGETNGEQGYLLTFVIAYIRDLGLEYSVVSESFETSISWDRAVNLCNNVKYHVSQECKRRGIEHHYICCRVTQTYDAGCVIYFYFAFNYKGLGDPVKIYEEIEEMARDEIVANGGSVSHHHGVGKLRRKWYEETVSTVGVSLFKATKKELDPNNVFATENLVKCKL